MRFNTVGEFYLWLEKYHICKLDSGSQGICYKIGNKVYKIFLQFMDELEDEIIEYDRDDILQFSSILNNTFIFPNDVITIGDLVIGYITDYVNAKSLYKIDPLCVDLNCFQSYLDDVYPDIKMISDCGVRSYDVIYNILYGKCGFKVIDTMEYTKPDIDIVDLYQINLKNFNNGIRLFLIDGYFDKFIRNNNYLYDMCYDQSVDFRLFLQEFRNRLSENEGYEINKLGEAKKSMVITKSKKPKYIREINL